MAESNAHKFGQLIGDLLELALEPELRNFAAEHSLFLDKKGERKARSGRLLTWTDGGGNNHNLDFVLERGGTDESLGFPAAFIEIAWRRYTKHSKNKVQEITDAIIPLAEKYSYTSPFKAAILAGNFTKPSIAQLESLGFSVLYFKYDTIVAAFEKFGLNADTDERTTEEEMSVKIKMFIEYPNKSELAKELLHLNREGVDSFFAALKFSVSRNIKRVHILPLHGNERVIDKIEDAVEYVKNYTVAAVGSMALIRYEIIIIYNTGDEIKASFIERKDALNFLESYQ